MRAAEVIVTNEFEQRIEPVRGGRVRFRVAIDRGAWSQRWGRNFGQHLLGERTREGWKLYHRSTGMMLLHEELRTYAAARSLATRLEVSLDLTRVEYAGFIEVPSGQRVAAIDAGVKLRGIG